MTRLVFPENQDAFVYDGPGEPIRQSGEVGLRIYSDADCTTLASILELDGDEILGSLVFIDQNGLLPLFQGPNNGASSLWVKGSATPVFEINAKVTPRLEAVIDTAAEAASNSRSAASSAAEALASVATHSETTTGIHGINDTDALVYYQTGRRVDGGTGINLYDQIQAGEDPPVAVITYDSVAGTLLVNAAPVGGGIQRGDDVYGESEGDILLALNTASGDLIARFGGSEPVYFPTMRANYIYGETIVAGTGGIASGAALNANGSGSFRSSDATQPTVLARMAPAQTQPAQVWQNSSGTALASMTSEGDLRVRRVRIDHSDTGGIEALNNAGNPVRPITWVNFSNTLILGGPQANVQINPSEAIWTTTGGDGWTFRNIDANHKYEMRKFNGAAHKFIGGEAGAPTMVVQMAPGQTTDAQRWNNSSGTTLTRVTSVGGVHLIGEDIYLDRQNGAGFRAIRSTTGAMEIQGEQAGSTQPLRLGNPTGGVSIHGDLDFQRDMVMSPTRQLAFYNGEQGTRLALNPTLGSKFNLVSTAADDAVALTLNVSKPTQFPLVIIGAPAQSQDLTRWQNSAGTPLTRVSSAGDITARAFVLSGNGGASTRPAIEGPQGQRIWATADGGWTMGTSLGVGALGFDGTGKVGFGKVEIDRSDFRIWINREGANKHFIRFDDGAGTYMGGIIGTGEYESGRPGNGIYLRSPDGTRYRITVANGGALTTTAA